MDAGSQQHKCSKVYKGIPAASIAELDQNTSYARVLALLERGGTVLDVGCGSGELDRYLAERGFEVWAIDGNAEALALAAPYCADARQADFEAADLSDLYAGVSFDYIIFADSLEHVREPWRLLESARRLLKPGGAVIASIPNVAHAAVRIAVAAGSFPYRKSGILDDTHLRFFTRSGIEALFAESGFHVEAMERTYIPFGAESELIPDVGRLRAPPEFEREIRETPEAETLQFVVRAVPLPGSWDMSAMRSYVHDLQGQLEESAIGMRNLDRIAKALSSERDALRSQVDDANVRAAESERRASEAEPIVAKLRHSAQLASRLAEQPEAGREIPPQGVAVQLDSALGLLRDRIGKLTTEKREARAEIAELRRRLAALTDERNELKQRELDRDALSRIVDEYDGVVPSLERNDGGQVWTP